MSNTNLLSQAYVKVDGHDVPVEFMHALIEVTIESTLHMPDAATLTIHDPRLQWIDNPMLALGTTVEISTKANAARGDSHIIFDGEIVEIEPDFNVSTHYLALRAFDRLHRLARGRRVRTFQNATDSDVAEQIARECGLASDVQPTRQVHQHLFQHNETNLEFLRKRAAALGYLLYVERKTLCFRSPTLTEQPITLRWGEALSEFRPRLTTVDQVNTVTVRGWDPQTKQAIIGQATQGQGMPHTQHEKKAGDAARSAFLMETNYLVSQQPVRTQMAADQLAQAVANRLAERFLEAEGSCAGDPRIVAGASLQIAAVGDQYGGVYFVTSATHQYGMRYGYITHFSVSGQTPTTLLQTLSPQTDAKDAGIGLVIGVVTDNHDPDGVGRVKVKYPWLSDEHTSDWVRVVAIGGGPQRGIQFLPEVNDEVLIGFEMSDLHQPYVIGGLWNGKDKPPQNSAALTQGGQVQQRIIRSRAGHVITLDDSDNKAGVTIQDKNGNRIQIDSRTNTLEIAVKGDLTLKADGAVKIQGRTIDLN